MFVFTTVLLTEERMRILDICEEIGKKGGTFGEVIGDLAPSTSYYYRVRAYNSASTDGVGLQAPFHSTQASNKPVVNNGAVLNAAQVLLSRVGLLPLVLVQSHWVLVHLLQIAILTLSYGLMQMTPPDGSGTLRGKLEYLQMVRELGIGLTRVALVTKGIPV